MTTENRSLTPPLRVIVTGGSGRMGLAISQAVRESNDLVLAAITVREGRPAPAVTSRFGQQIPTSSKLEELIDKADVVIDFTTPESSVDNARVCAEAKVPLVLGTTGFEADQLQTIESFAQKIPIVFAPNMSVGVNLLFTLARAVAGILGEDFDVEITEAHHRHKRDSPSGTALRLAEEVCAARDLEAEKDLVYGRRGEVGARPSREVGMQVIRGGDVVGDHTVHFLADGERLELTHRATSRMTFAMGALRAARFTWQKEPGLYDMLDVLGLSSTAFSRIAGENGDH